MQPTDHTASTNPSVKARHSNKTWLRQLALAAALTGLAASASAAQYTYKGELQDRGQPAQGKFDLRIHAYADAAGKRPLGDRFPRARRLREAGYEQHARHTGILARHRVPIPIPTVSAHGG